MSFVIDKIIFTIMFGMFLIAWSLYAVAVIGRPLVDVFAEDVYLLCAVFGMMAFTLPIIIEWGNMYLISFIREYWIWFSVCSLLVVVSLAYYFKVGLQYTL